MLQRVRGLENNQPQNVERFLGMTAVLGPTDAHEGNAIR